MFDIVNDCFAQCYTCQDIFIAVQIFRVVLVFSKMFIKHIHTNTVWLFVFHTITNIVVSVAALCGLRKCGDVVKSVCWEVQHITRSNNYLCGIFARINKTWVTNQIRCIDVHHGGRTTGHVQVIVLTRWEHDHTLVTHNLAKYIVKGVIMISQLQR